MKQEGAESKDRECKEKNMRMAICFSGRAGSHQHESIQEFCWDNITTKFINPAKELGYEIDIFCHFWETKEWKKTIELIDPLKYQIEKDQSAQLQIDFEDMFFRRHPKETAHIDRTIVQKGVFRPGPATTFWPNNWANMFCSIWKANELKKQHEDLHDFKYDLVVRMRSDSIFAVNFKEEIRKCMEAEDNEIYIPHAFRSRGNFPRGSKMTYVIDTFGLGNSQSMDLYSKTWPNAEDITLRGLRYHKKTHKACGTMLGTNLGMQDVKINPILLKGEPELNTVVIVRLWEELIEKHADKYPDKGIIQKWKMRNE